MGERDAYFDIVGTTVQSPILYAPGTLWNAIVARSRTALERGALQPIATRRHTVPDGGVPFQVRVVSSLARYRDDNAAKRRDGAKKGNPFLPHATDLFVTDVTRTHVCLLNKYNVIANHTLIVTRAFEPQESPLTLEDFQVLWTCMREFKALGFYHSGSGAGASQPHKHLQLVPLPLTEEVSLPIAVLFPPEEHAGALLRIDRFPFAHTFVRLSRRARARPMDSHQLCVRHVPRHAGVGWAAPAWLDARTSYRRTISWRPTSSCCSSPAPKPRFARLR